MAKKKYEASDLEGFIMTEASIECSNCKKGETVFFADYAEDELFKKGWRATEENVYCPKCAKNKLKIK